MVKTAVLDFNGTLLDDVVLSLHCLNRVVEKHLKREKVTLEEYREVFTFPVKDYYERVGFDFEKESFAAIGAEWFGYYQEDPGQYRLQDEALPFLEKVRKRGIECVLLSASRKSDLLAQCRQLRIEDYFTEIWGLGDIYAEGKKELALAMMKHRNPDETLFIGDSLHDSEVAAAVRADCVLVAKGHQSPSVLAKGKAKVVSSLLEVTL